MRFFRLFLSVSGLLLEACHTGSHRSACPEERMSACLKALAQAHTAFQAGWTAEGLSWPPIRRAALEKCGCDSASFENSLRRLLNNSNKLEKIFSEAAN